ncbi:MAG: Ribosomal RNA large subunit methyltransferase E [Candidatus Tokpelaia sp. JSC188]|nr:MAG: Ribosomal RNA large subunit methyltransferase E [Candidatus Tokpelaia sp. JSC188]
MKKTGNARIGGHGGSGSRKLYTRVKKKAGSIRASSRRWLERHLNDPYVHQSKVDGYRSRAAYKLIEINDRYSLLKKGQKVIDLGAAPGSWSQVAAHIVGSNNKNPSVVGIDCLYIDPIPGVISLEIDFLNEATSKKLLDALGEMPDVVLSDMAALPTGHRRTDYLRTANLCEAASEFALSVLKAGGHFLTKVFQGGIENELLIILKKKFKSVHHVKPPASRAESVEFYLLAREFRG